MTPAIMTCESFSILEGTIDGRPVVATINMALRDFAEKKRLPFFLSVGTRLQDPTSNGLPTSTEADDLIEWEHEIEARLTGQGKCVFVGRVTWNAQRELLFYVDNEAQFAGALRALSGGQSIRAFNFSCEKDSDWQRAALWLNRADSRINRGSIP